MKRNFFPVIFLCIILTSCGYTTHSVMHSGELSLYVENFVNKIEVTTEVSDNKAYYAYHPGMESDITRSVIDRFILDGIYRIKEADKAHFLLKGELIEFTREPLRYDTNDNVIEYRINIVVNLEFYDNEEKKTIWKEEAFSGETTYRTSGEFAKSENAAINDAIRDLAVRIVERTVEDW